MPSSWTPSSRSPTARPPQRYLDSGNYLWNSGIFMLRAGVWLELIERYRPEILAACRLGLRPVTRDMDFFRVDAEAFRACPSDSIDYAVMEPYAADAGSNVLVIPLDAGWSTSVPGRPCGRSAATMTPATRSAATSSRTARQGNLINAQHRMVAAVGVTTWWSSRPPTRCWSPTRSERRTSRRSPTFSSSRGAARAATTAACTAPGAPTSRSTSATGSRSSASPSSPGRRCRCRCTTTARSTGSWCAARRA